MENTFLIQKSRTNKIILTEVFCSDVQNDDTKIKIHIETGSDIYDKKRILVLTDEQIKLIEKLNKAKKIKK